MNGKRGFLIFFVVMVLLLGTAAIISYVEDPAGVFSGSKNENKIADILFYQGHNVANGHNCNERLLQKSIIKQDQREMDVIVLGSSRSLQIHNLPSSFGEKYKDYILFNHGVSSGTLDDDIAILELYVEKGTVPKIIIINVDPWILNANNDLEYWATPLKNEYQKGVARFNSTLNISELDSYNINYDIDRYSSLISRPIVISSMGNLLFNSSIYYETDLTEVDVGVDLGIVLHDGSYIFPKAVRSRTVEQVDMEARNYAHCDDDLPIGGLGNFTHLDGNLKNQFESTVRYFKNRNVTIILFLPAQHPILQDKTAQDSRYSQVKEAELYFKNFAASENITIIGSYDPYQMNLTSADFYDGSHLRREAIDRIFAAETLGKPMASEG